MCANSILFGKPIIWHPGHMAQPSESPVANSVCNPDEQSASAQPWEERAAETKSHHRCSSNHACEDVSLARDI